MRIALKLAYVGTDYYGFQIQPNVPTIEGELFKALRTLNIIKDPRDAKYIASGRTDKGVHAIGNVIAFNTDNPKLAIPRVINSKLPDSVWTWARAEVQNNFNPRFDALYREYVYILYGMHGKEKIMQSASKLLIGTHDFANFVTQNKERNTVRTIYGINIHGEGEFILINIKANSFMWNMVRKIVTALTLISNGIKDEEWLSKMLNPRQYREGLESAPEYGLILKKVEYSNIKWIEDEYSKKRAYKKIHNLFLLHSVMSKSLDVLQKSF
ncbi:MAG: tRNA pseudouridine(38-40) synthase TruA [Methanosarcinales archaeon]